jgi:hypothetical protein
LKNAASLPSRERGSKRQKAVTDQLAGVAEQVEKGLAHLREIGLQCPETLGTTNLEPVAVLRNQRRDRRYHLLEHGRDLEGLEMHHRQRIHFRLTTVGPF